MYWEGSPPPSRVDGTLLNGSPPFTRRSSVVVDSVVLSVASDPEGARPQIPLDRQLEKV